MFRVGLEDYTVYGKHGAYQAEHAYEQPFIVSIWVELAHGQFSDELSNTINYANLQDVAYNVIANSPPIKLMETMISKMFEEISQNRLVKRGRESVDIFCTPCLPCHKLRENLTIFF